MKINRRGFLQGLASLAGAPLIPNTSAVSEEPEQSINAGSLPASEGLAHARWYDRVNGIPHLVHPEECLEYVLQNPLNEIEYINVLNSYTRRIKDDVLLEDGYSSQKIEECLIPLFQRARTAVKQFPTQTDEERSLQVARLHAMEIRTDEVSLYARTRDTKAVLDNPDIQAKQERYFPESEMLKQSKEKWRQYFQQQPLACQKLLDKIKAEHPEN
jgi:hypothetical protein